jgi:hypothetical protein
VALDRGQGGQDGPLQVAGAREAGEGGEALQLGLAGGQRLGLLVGHHLEAVLQAAQGAVGPGQLGRGRGLDPAALGQEGQRPAGLRHAQLGHAPAQHELLRLGEELDLADAAAPDLQVVARHLDRGEAAVGVDLALDRVDVADRGVVEVLAPDERDEAAQEAWPASMSPATAEALISAARSQFCPWRS